MANNIYSKSFNNIISRIMKYGTDFKKINRTLPDSTTKLLSRPMLNYQKFILPYQYKDSYIEFDIDFNKTNCNIEQALINYAVLLRYVHKELANPESVLLKLWSVCQNIISKHPNIPFNFTPEYLTKSCIEPSFSDTTENLITKFDIDLDELHNNFIKKHSYFYINPKISDDKEEIKKAKIAWLLYAAKYHPVKTDPVWANSTQFNTAQELYKNFKGNKIKLEDFIAILEVYDSNVPNVYISKLLGVSVLIVNRFKTVYNIVFGENIKRKYKNKNAVVETDKQKENSTTKIAPKNIKFNLSYSDDVFDDFISPTFSVDLNEGLKI